MNIAKSEQHRPEQHAQRTAERQPYLARPWVIALIGATPRVIAPSPRVDRRLNQCRAEARRSFKSERALNPFVRTYLHRIFVLDDDHIMARAAVLAAVECGGVIK